MALEAATPALSIPARRHPPRRGTRQRSESLGRLRRISLPSQTRFHSASTTHERTRGFDCHSNPQAAMNPGIHPTNPGIGRLLRRHHAVGRMRARQRPGVLHPCGALRRPSDSRKRQRTGALQDAAASLHPLVFANSVENLLPPHGYGSDWKSRWLPAERAEQAENQAKAKPVASFFE